MVHHNTTHKIDIIIMQWHYQCYMEKTCSNHNNTRNVVTKTSSSMLYGKRVVHHNTTHNVVITKIQHHQCYMENV